VTRAQQRWQRYVAEHGEAPTGGVIGYDVASEGADENVVTHRVGDFVRRYTPEMRWNGVDSAKGARKAVGLYSRLQWTRAVVDVTGVGDGVPTQLNEQQPQQTATGVQFGAQAPEPSELQDSGIVDVDANCHRMRDFLYWSVREWLRTGDAMLPPDDDLAEELTTLTYQRDELQGIQVMKKSAIRTALGRSPDKLDSLACTFAPKQAGVSYAEYDTDDLFG
jgi:hypothetical protein